MNASQTTPDFGTETEHFVYLSLTSKQRFYKTIIHILQIAFLGVVAWETLIGTLLGLLALCALYRAMIGWLHSREAAQSPINAYADGLWLATRGKADGLVPWGDIAALRQRGDRLEVLNTDGERLIDVSLLLHDVQH